MQSLYHATTTASNEAKFVLTKTTEYKVGHNQTTNVKKLAMHFHEEK